MSKTQMLGPAENAPKLSEEEKDRLNKEFVTLESENFNLITAIESYDGKIKFLISLTDQLKKEGDETVEKVRRLLEKKVLLQQKRDEIVKKLGLKNVFSITTHDEVL